MEEVRQIVDKGNKKNMTLEGEGKVTLGVSFDDNMCRFRHRIKVDGTFILYFADIPEEECKDDTITRGRYRGCWC